MDTGEFKSKYSPSSSDKKETQGHSCCHSHKEEKKQVHNNFQGGYSYTSKYVGGLSEESSGSCCHEEHPECEVNLSEMNFLERQRHSRDLIQRKIIEEQKMAEERAKQEAEVRLKAQREQQLQQQQYLQQQIYLNNQNKQ